MKKFLVFALVGLTVLSLAFVPGMKKRLYGGDIFLWPFPVIAGVGGYFMEGTNLYSIPDMKIEVDGYIGPGFSAGFASIGYASGMAMEMEALGSIIISKEDWYFNLFGYKITPAIKLDTGLYYSFAGSGFESYYYLHGSGFGLLGPDIYLTFYASWMKGKYMNFFFWPIPLVFGFNVIEY